MWARLKSCDVKRQACRRNLKSRHSMQQAAQPNDAATEAHQLHATRAPLSSYQQRPISCKQRPHAQCVAQLLCCASQCCLAAVNHCIHHQARITSSILRHTPPLLGAFKRPVCLARATYKSRYAAATCLAKPGGDFINVVHGVRFLFHRASKW